MSVCMWGVSSEINYRDHITSHQLQPPSHPLLSCSPTFSPCYLNKMHLGLGMYVSVAKSFHCIFHMYISPLLEKQRMFCWGPFSVSASVIPVRLPSVPAYGSPQCQATGNEVFVSPEGGMKRGICFTAVGDKAAEEIIEGRKNMKGR